MPDIEGDDGVARAHYVCSLPLYMMEIRRVQLCLQQKLRDLEIAHWCRAISRLRKPSVQSQFGTQFPDSKNALRNLEIAQIPRLRKTYLLEGMST